MSQAVVIKSNKYGINLVLDKTMPFRELLVAIKEKFLESEKFFKDAKMAISFEGRELTQEEEYQIIETITENTSISIICIVDNDESHADLVKQQIDAYYDSVSGREGEVYRGTLRSGQVLERVSSVVIVGDVNPGAKIISQVNIVLLCTFSLLLFFFLFLRCMMHVTNRDIRIQRRNGSISCIRFCLGNLDIQSFCINLHILGNHFDDIIFDQFHHIRGTVRPI